MKPSDVKCGALYRHYKGGLYRVLGFADIHTETLETMVIYGDVETSAIWVRPIAMFCSKVRDVQRFTEVDDERVDM